LTAQIAASDLYRSDAAGSRAGLLALARKCAPLALVPCDESRASRVSDEVARHRPAPPSARPPTHGSRRFRRSFLMMFRAKSATVFAVHPGYGNRFTSRLGSIDTTSVPASTPLNIRQQCRLYGRESLAYNVAAGHRGHFWLSRMPCKRRAIRLLAFSCSSEMSERRAWRVRGMRTCFHADGGTTRSVTHCRGWRGSDNGGLRRRSATVASK